MTDTNKHIPSDQKAAENKMNASGELKDTELENVSGGFLSNSVNQVIKTIGQSLSTMARGG